MKRHALVSASANTYRITSVRALIAVVLLTVVTAVASVGTLSSGAPVSANGHVEHQNGGGIEVDSAANVTADNSQPIIECKWELPDVDSELAGIQYGQDDDPNSGPDYPCDREADPGERPFMADNVQNVIQVLPNAEDLPEARKIENWVAVEHPNGVDEIDDVFWKVLHPDGSFKFQIHGIKVQVADSGDGELGTDSIVDLNDLGSTSMPGTMWYAAHQTEQITTGAVHTTDYGFIDLILQRQKDLYYQWWEISKDQMCGLYNIEATAVANGSTATMTNTLDIQCFFNLEIDFDSIDWGTITPGGTKVLPGDTSFGTSEYPTVKNTGNTGMRVGIEFSELVQDNVLGPKIIDTFDAAFGKNAQVLEWIDPIDAYETVWFSNDNLDQVLCNNEVGKLDLSVHPPSIVPSGSYSGYVTVLAELADAVCPNDFVFIEDLFTEVKVIASDADDALFMGEKVSIDGDTAIVGGRGDDELGSFAGAAYIFERNEGGPDAWGETNKLLASDGEPFDNFGTDVAISGDIAVVGASGEDEGGTTAGAAYVFGRNVGGPDNWGQIKKLLASDIEAFDNFGRRVAIDGDTILVGSPSEDNNRGAVYIYNKDEGGADNWGEVTKITDPDATPDEAFGFSVAIDGDTVVVGNYNDDITGFVPGSALIFERNEGGPDNWGVVRKRTASNAGSSDNFGFSVSISGDTVVVGARFEDDNGSNAGAAYIFERNEGGPGNWGEVTILRASDGEQRDNFGSAVAISGDTVLVGSRGDDDGGDSAGSAYLFGRNEGGPGNWGEIDKLLASDAEEGDAFGASVAIDNGTALIGAQSEDNAFGDGAGAAYFFFE